jgi:hypothetical protein
MESTTSTSAQAQVFDVPELVEGILALVPEREIPTRIQRVSTTWKTVVEDSPSIQQRIGRHKGRTIPPETPKRMAEAWTEDEEDDFGIPIYKMPIPMNSVFEGTTELYQDCNMWYTKDLARNLSFYPGPNWSKHTISIESFRSKDYPNTPAFSDNHQLSWRDIQICDPPITAARLHTYSGMELWDFEVVRLIEISATVFDEDGITMGLVHDIAAATLRHNTGEEDPRLDWRLDLCWGTEDSPEAHASGPAEWEDEGVEAGGNDRLGEWDRDDWAVDESDDGSVGDDLDDSSSESEDGGVASEGETHDGGEGDAEVEWSLDLVKQSKRNLILDQKWRVASGEPERNASESQATS